MESRRLAGWCGIAFSLLSLIVLPLVSFSAPPPLGAEGSALSAWYASHRLGFLVGNYLGLVAFVPGFVQLAALGGRIRQLEGAGGWLSTLVVASGTFTYAVFACSLVVFQALPFLVGPRLYSEMEAMGILATLWFSLDGLAAVPLIVAVAVATARTGALPKGFTGASWAVAALALAMSLGALTATPPWFAAGGALTGLGFLVFFAWTFAIGVVFLKRPA